MAKKDIQKAMEELGFKKVQRIMLTRKDYNEVIEYWNQDNLSHTNAWEVWVR